MTRRRLARIIREDTGAATAEYAVVSVAAAALAGLLLKILTSEWLRELLKTILEGILTMLLQAIGLR